MRLWRAGANWGVGVSLLAIALGGCSDDGASAGPSGSSVLDESGTAGVDGPVLRHVGGYVGEGEDAEIRGVVTIEGPCLYVVLDEVGERYPVVWPAGTAWDGEAGRVLLPTGESLGDGDAVHGGGGYRYVADVEAVAGERAAGVADRCVDNRYGEIAVVNNQSEAIGLDG